MRLGHLLLVVVCVDEQKSAKKYFTWTFMQSCTQFQQLLTWITSYTLCAKKSNYTYLVEQNSVLPHPPDNHWPAQPPHTFDMWGRSQLENCREESASSLCWLPRRTRSTAATSVFVLLPVSCSVMCDQLNLASLRLFTLDWSGVTWERESLLCILKLTNMCSPQHQYYLPAPGLMLPWNITRKGTGKSSW